MKEFYDEEVATHIAPDPYAGGGNALGVASVMGTGKQAIELRNPSFACRPCGVRGKTIRTSAFWRADVRRGGVVEPQRAWKLQTREPGDPAGFRSQCVAYHAGPERSENAQAVPLT